MGYSTSVERTLIPLLPLLEPLKTGPCVWKAKDDGSPAPAKRLAYKLREGLYIAKLNKDQYPELAAAAETYRIEIVNTHTVQARQAASPTEAEVLVGVAPIQGLEKAGRAAATSGQQTAESIIAAWKSAQPSSEPMHFPQANLGEEELLKLYQLVQGLEPEWVFFEFSGAITLKKPSLGEADLSWSPADIGLVLRGTEWVME